MDALCFKEDYDSLFDIHTYLAMNFSEENIKIGVTQDGYLLKLLHQVFEKIEQKADARLLDFGTGPSMYTVFSASRVFPNITLAEYAAQNRAELERWMKSDSKAFDWSAVLSIVSGLEGLSASEIANRTRTAIQEVIPCDATKPDILLDPMRVQYDFIVSVLCLEASCASLDIHREAIAKLCRLVREGGGLFLCGVLGESFYCVGSHKFSCLPVSKQHLRESLEVCGMDIEMFECIHHQGNDGDLSDGQGSYYIHATKKQQQP